MTPNMSVAVTLADRNDGAIIGAFDEITAQVFRQPAHRLAAKVSLHVPDTLRRKITDDCAVSGKRFLTIIQQPMLDQGRNTALLRALNSVLSLHDITFRR